MSSNAAQTITDFTQSVVLLGGLAASYYLWTQRRVLLDAIDKLNPVKRIDETLSQTATENKERLFGITKEDVLDALAEQRQAFLSRLNDVLYGHIAEIGALGGSQQFTQDDLAGGSNKL